MNQLNNALDFLILLKINMLQEFHICVFPGKSEPNTTPILLQWQNITNENFQRGCSFLFLKFGVKITRLFKIPNTYIPKTRRKARTVADGLNGNSRARKIQGLLGIHEIGQYLLLWHMIQDTTLNNHPDQLL